MDKGTLLNIRLETGEPKISCSLMQLVLKKLEQLEQKGITVEYFELRLHRLNEVCRNKEAHVKIDAFDWTFTNSGISSRWDDAFMSAYDQVLGHLMSYRKDLPSAIISQQII